MSSDYTIETIEKPLAKLVVKRNDFVDLKTMFSVREHKLINFLISKVNRDANTFEEISLSLNDVAQIINTTAKDNASFELSKANGRLLMELKDIISTIRKKDIWLVKNDYTFQTLGFFHSVKLDTKNNIASFILHNDLAPYLLQQEKEFTQYKLKNVVALKSKYSIILYELLKRKVTIGKDVIKLDKLRYILGLDEKIGERIKMKNFTDFERTVLQKAQKELALKTDLKFSYTFQKLGRSVECITFFPKHNKTAKPIEKIPTLEPAPNFSEIKTAEKSNLTKDEKMNTLFESLQISREDRLNFLCIPNKGLSTAVKDYIEKNNFNFEDYLIEKLELAIFKRNSIKDLEAYLYKAITENYRSQQVKEESIKKQQRLNQQKDRQRLKQLDTKLTILLNERSNIISTQILLEIEKHQNQELEAIILKFLNENTFFKKDFEYKFDRNILNFLSNNRIAFSTIVHIIETQHQQLLPIIVPQKLNTDIAAIKAEIESLNKSQ